MTLVDTFQPTVLLPSLSLLAETINGMRGNFFGGSMTIRITYEILHGNDDMPRRRGRLLDVRNQLSSRC